MLLSIVMAGIAVFFVMTAVTSIEDSAKQKFGDEVTVLVAKQNIKEMDTIQDTMLEPKSVPKRFVEPNAISFNSVVSSDRPEYAMEVKRIVGMVSLVPIRQGEQLTLTKVTEPNIKTGLAPQIAPGKRAITVPVDEYKSVGKMMKPGDRVDVIALIDRGSSARELKIAKTIMQDVVVLAVGRAITNNLQRRIDVDPSSGKSRIKSLTDFDGYTSVTLEVDPSQAQVVAAITASSGNSLMFTLRNNDDTERAPLNSVIATDVFYNDARFPASQTAPAPSTGGRR